MSETTDAAPWTTLSSEVLADGLLVRLRRDRVAMPGGQVATRDVAACTQSVGVVPVMPDGSVVLVHQYRHAVGRRLLEIPAGLLDHDGEDRATAARRELAEEVRLGADDLVELTTFFCSPGWTDEHTTVFLATGLRPVAEPDDFEAEHEEADMEVVRIPLSDALTAVRDGTIRDAKTIVGLQLAGDRLLRGAG